MSLSIEQGTVGTAAAVRMTGVVDWSTLGQFRSALVSLVSGSHRQVRLDVAGVVFSSPEAPLVLRRYVARARQRGGDLVVEGFSLPAQREVHEYPAEQSATAEPDHRLGSERRSRACHPAAATGRLRIVPAPAQTSEPDPNGSR